MEMKVNQEVELWKGGMVDRSLEINAMKDICIEGKQLSSRTMEKWKDI